MHEIVFDKKINAGNVIEIVLILATLVWMYANTSAQVNRNTQSIVQLTEKTRAMTLHNEQTYMRKDVTDQILIRLEDIANRLQRIEEKGN